MRIIIFVLFVFSIITPSKLNASCWEGYPWGKSEITTVESDWIKTIVMSELTSYVAIQNIDGGQCLSSNESGQI